MSATLLVTGGAGFIGSCFVRQHLASRFHRIINLDALTYAGNLDSIPEPNDDDHRFVHGSILDRTLVAELLSNYRPRAIVHFAAESHVDRSIDGPSKFVETNVVGTCNLLEVACDHYKRLDPLDQKEFRFFHISTDEVFGSLGPTGQFTETSPYAPNSPYAASKASSDLFVRAYRETFQFPTLISNCSNNYGPYQFPEKMIPLMILNAIEGKPLPVYGDGKNIRDWIHVEDHCRAISLLLDQGRVGEAYNVGGGCERTNLEVVETLCDLVDAELRRPAGTSRSWIRFVEDRPGHDRRYAMDCRKIETETGWRPNVAFHDGLKQTVQWYCREKGWVSRVLSGGYRRERLGMGSPRSPVLTRNVSSDEERKGVQ